MLLNTFLHMQLIPTFRVYNETNGINVNYEETIQIRDLPPKQVSISCWTINFLKSLNSQDLDSICISCSLTNSFINSIIWYVLLKTNTNFKVKLRDSYYLGCTTTTTIFTIIRYTYNCPWIKCIPMEVHDLIPTSVNQY